MSRQNGYKSVDIYFGKLIIFAIPVSILCFVFAVGWFMEGSQQFSLLAQAFLHGHLNFLGPIGGLGQDPILYGGRIYWGEGPFPSIILMPFVSLFSIFHILFYQGYIKWLFMLGIGYFIFKLAKKLKYSSEDSLVMTLGFMLGSVFIGAASVSSSWLFAQVVTTFLLLWSLYEFYNQKRWWLIGIICGLVFLTRATAAPIIIFFLLELYQSHKTVKVEKRQYLQLILPLCTAILLEGLYNYIRFHSPFNGGYKYQLLYPSSVQSLSHGVFSIVHIPSNLYSMFLRSPVPVLHSTTSWLQKFPFIENNPYGMSIFITSPYLLYFFTQKWSVFGKREKNLMIAIAISCLLVLSFFGNGIQQFGYRYSLDFMPELFLLFMIVYKKKHKNISRGMKALLLGSGITNFYLLLSFI